MSGPTITNYGRNVPTTKKSGRTLPTIKKSGRTFPTLKKSGITFPTTKKNSRVLFLVAGGAPPTPTGRKIAGPTQTRRARKGGTDY